jgi:hypothetical protein
VPERNTMQIAIAGTLFVALSGALSAETFVKHNRWFQVGPNPCAIVTADLNGDGLPEIVTADRGEMVDTREERPANDELSLLVAGPDLKYENKPPLRAGFAPWCIAVANVDAFKALDLVVGSFHDTRGRDLTLFRNLGENGFEPSTYTVPDGGLKYESVRDDDDRPIYAVPGITAVAVRDINHDSFRDVVATGWSSGVLIVFPGNGDTYLSEPRIIEAPGGPRDLQLVDFDGDGEVDAVTTMYNTNEIALWKGNAKGEFTEVKRYPSLGLLPHKVRVADMNGDGKTDIIVSHCFSSDSLAIHFGSGNFSFDVSQEIEVGTNNDRRVVQDQVRDILVADFNADGKPDIAASCFASSRVCVFINRSTGTGAPLTFEREVYTYKDARPYALSAADLNQDGKMDIAVTLWEANAVAVLLGR